MLTPRSSVDDWWTAEGISVDLVRLPPKTQRQVTNANFPLSLNPAQLSSLRRISLMSPKTPKSSWATSSACSTGSVHRTALATNVTIFNSFSDSQIDPNPVNAVAAGVLHMSGAGKVGCLLRLEPNKDAKVCSGPCLVLLSLSQLIADRPTPSFSSVVSRSEARTTSQSSSIRVVSTPRPLTDSSLARLPRVSAEVQRLVALPLRADNTA